MIDQSTTELMTDEELQQLVAANARAISDLRTSVSDLRTSVSDLRASVSDLRDIAGGHERRIIRLEGKEVDTWGDYLTLFDRVRELEEWKRRQERE